MFPAICLQVVHEVGNNTLIPSPSIDESKRLLPLNVVTMRKKRKYLFRHHIEYTAHDISLTDLFIDQQVLEVQVEESKCCWYNNPEGIYTLHGKIDADMKNIVNISPSASGKVAITVKVGELLCQEIRDANFMFALKKRKLDMNNHFISEIKATKSVLCVVKGVIKTIDKTEIKRTDITGVNIKLSEKVTSTIDVDVGGSLSSAREIVIEPGITLAYKVWELDVDVDCGEIIPIMMRDNSGGFFKHKTVQGKRSSQHSVGTVSSAKKTRECPPMKETAQTKRRSQYSACALSLATKATENSPMKDEDEVAAALKDLQDILQPLRDCTKADGQIKSSLLDLMFCYGDVVAMSQILSKAENRNLNEDKDTLDKQFINNDAVWSILEFAGVQTKKGRVLYKRKATLKLIAVAYMIDAILEIENDDLDTIYHCDEPQLKTLSNIFESAITSSKTIFIPSVLTESVSSFLTGLDFTVSKDGKRILPPKIKTCVAECIFCVLYCLSS